MREWLRHSLLLLGVVVNVTVLTQCRMIQANRKEPVYPSPVRFRYYPMPNEEPETVYLTGDFNDWAVDNIEYLMEKEDEGNFILDVDLPNGDHRFNFVINGEKWIGNMDKETNRYEPRVTRYRSHDFGRIDAVIKIKSKK